MISVIVPTRNAQETLPRCFNSLISATVHGEIREVILADGGSEDETLTIADAVGARIVHAGATPVAQMNDGAAVARGDWLLFLYPETALSPGWDVEVGVFMNRSGAAAGVFSFSLEEFDAAARRAEVAAQLRTRLCKLPHGEQGLLIRRDLFQKLGGYRECAMPDVDMVRRIGAGRMVTFRAQAVLRAEARPRRVPHPILSALYATGLSPELVAKIF